MQADKSRKRETEKQEARFPPKTKGKKKYKIKKKKKEIHQPNATGRACDTKEVKDGQGS